jgi:SWI/SNF-related matrix-associated actin-dependent regulator 1 of chromatin subfamily A
MSYGHGTPSRLTADGRLYRRYDPSAGHLLRSLPGAEWNPGGKYWSVSLDHGDRRRVLEVADLLGIEEVAPELVLPLSPAALRAQTACLYPFQVEGVGWLSQRQKALLADEMGLGKTPQALFALPDQAAALVICPGGLTYTWKAEVARWRPDLTPVVVEGRKGFRLPAPGELVVVSYGNLPDEVEGVSLGSVHLVADEAHWLKGKDSMRTKRFRKLAASVGSVWALTGTPLLNHPGELLNMLTALGMVEETYGHRGKFYKLFNADKNRWGGTVWGQPDPLARELLRRVMLRRLRCDVMPQLPSKQYRTHVVPLPPKERGLLRDMDELWGGYRQYLVADDLPPIHAFSAVRERLAKTRIRAMVDIVEKYEEQGEPLVVFSAHRAPVEALRGRPGWAVITGDTPTAERQAFATRFQAGELNGVALTIGAGGVGLTLTRASTVLFVDLAWTPADNVQAEDRVCRITQEAEMVQAIRMVSEHALDCRVLEVLDRKAELERAVVGRGG